MPAWTAARGSAMALAMASLLCASVQAEAAFIVGITTHLMNFEIPPRKHLQLAVDAGITSLKDDAFWSTAEPVQYQMRIVPQWRNYLDVASSLNLSRLTILDYSTHFYDNAKPRTPKVKAAYLNYVDYVTSQLGNKVDFYEIWNEWDLEAPKDPKLAADYATLVKEAAPIIRRNTKDVPGPQAKILAGSVTPEGMDYGFADRLIDAGVLEAVDGLSVHPYAHCAANGGNTPERWVIWLRDYEQHIRRKAGRAVPLYLTEMAWPSHTGPCGNTPETQAAYMARIFFLARTLPNIKGMWWYDLVNDGTDRTDQEHNFGLLNEDLTPKPAYTVLKAISPVVRDFTYDARQSQLSGNVYTLYFHKGAERVVVAWAIGKPYEQKLITQNAQTGAVQWTDTAHADKGRINGKPWVCKAGQCSVSVTLTDFPKIISLSPGAPVLAK